MKNIMWKSKHEKKNGCCSFHFLVEQIFPLQFLSIWAKHILNMLHFILEQNYLTKVLVFYIMAACFHIECSTFSKHKWKEIDDQVGLRTFSLFTRTKQPVASCKTFRSWVIFSKTWKSVSWSFRKSKTLSAWIISLDVGP